MKTKLILGAIAAVLMSLAFLSGCGLKAPSVPYHKAQSNTPALLGLEEMCASVQDVTQCGRVEIAMTSSSRTSEGDDRWVYWRAGTNQVIYNAAPELVASPGWDMRVTKIMFPLVGSNGGATAANEGFPGALASFSVVPDARRGFVPRQVSDLAALSFRDDEFASLEFQGFKLPPDYQSMLVNTIGSGMLSEYSMENNHRYTLSQRVFILRTADGASYYAIRFESYERNTRTVFTWRKIL